MILVYNLSFIVLYLHYIKLLQSQQNGRFIITYLHIMQKTALLAIVAVLLVGASISIYKNQESKDVFLEWKSSYNMQWVEEEDRYRRIIFFKNLATIEKHNADASQTYKMGVNQFTGLTDEEFVSIYLTPKHNPSINEPEVAYNPSNIDVDWTTKGMVSPVKNQGSCGSCWAFSAVGVLESWALSKGQTVNLSEQQLVDCSKKYGNAGCNGGFNYKGLAYVLDNGITTTSQYAYTAKTGTCKSTGGSFKISKINKQKGCTYLDQIIAQRPLGVSADATNWSKYSSGIFTNCKRSLNHDILLVGATSEYYKIKNSWGPTWGEKGFIRLAKGNTCGVCDDYSPWVQ